MKRNSGFTLVELICVLVILALLALIIGRVVVKNISEAKEEITDSQKKAILNAAEKWSVDNSDRFDDIDSQKITVGLDVVFIVDMSGSMAGTMVDGNAKTSATVDAINTALETLKENELNRVGFVLFSGLDSNGSSSSNPLWSANKSIVYKSNNLVSVSDINDLIYSKNGNSQYMTVQGTRVQFLGGTYTQLGIQTAAQLLSKNDGVDKNGRIPVIILLTDGEPSTGVANYDITVENYLSTRDADHGHGATTWCLSSAVYPTFWNYYKGLSYVKTYCDKVTSYPASQATNRSVKMVWNVIQTSAIAKQQLSKTYGSAMYFYTIGIGLTSDFGKFMLEPNENRLNALSTSRASTGVERYSKSTADYWDTLWHVDISENLYNFIINNNKKDYNYVTKAFLNSASLDDLKANFKQIATEISEATKVTEVCVSVDELYNGGYLSTKDIKLSSGDALSNYVLMSYNEPTNQYSYVFAETEEQKKTCKQYIDSYNK